SVKGEAVCDAPNLLLRKWAAPEFSVSAGIDISCLMPGDMAGLVSLGRRYFVLGFCREQDEIRMIFGTGEIGGNERFREFPPVKTEEIKPDIRLGMNVRADGTGSFLLNEGNCWKMICEGVSFTPGYWTGVKYGFFAVHSGKAAKTEAGSLFVKDVVVSEKQLTVLS
ncbi:MAG: hypothetical protein IKN57_14005, partial [Parasporobacterium sp.]|nr:hypothetical protein [Parasporobacterium sp.]